MSEKKFNYEGARRAFRELNMLYGFPPPGIGTNAHERIKTPFKHAMEYFIFCCFVGNTETWAVKTNKDGEGEANAA